MPAQMKEFDAKVDGWVADSQERLEALARQSIQNLCEAVVLDTPVVVGFLRGGWQPSVGQPAPVMDNRQDPGGGMALADVAVKLGQLTLGETFYFSNHVIYARRVEYGFVGEDSLGRYYNQAGRFYLASNAARWQEFVSEAAQQLGGAK